MKQTLLIATLLFSFTGFSQTVSTFYQTTANTDLAVDKNGNVYASHATAEIRQIDATGSSDSSFLAGSTLNRATGLAFDPTGEILYVSCRPINQLGWITKVNADGSDSILAENLYLPGDIVVDTSGNLFVTEMNSNIKKITPAGIVTNYVSLPSVNASMGIAWTPGDTLYVSSAHDGNIYKVAPGASPTVTWHAHVSGLVQQWACGYMTYHSGNLYITNGDNIIHQISVGSQATVTDFAGTGVPGWVDGPANSAQFSAPNGICVNEDNTRLYVTEFGKNRIRSIENLNDLLEPAENPIDAFICSPNPIGEIAAISFSLKSTEHVTLTIYDQWGKKVKQLVNSDLIAGANNFNWNVEDELGNRVISGMYYCTLLIRNSYQTIQLIVI